MCGNWWNGMVNNKNSNQLLGAHYVIRIAINSVASIV